jgi:hypothetical protein
MEERRPRHIDQVWAENFLIAVRCQEAAAVRDRTLRQFESLTPPCRDEYAKHRMAEILKAMGATAAPAAPKIQGLE